MGVLRRLFGEAIPRPNAVAATKWAADPYARGARLPKLDRVLPNLDRVLLQIHGGIQMGQQASRPE